MAIYPSAVRRISINCEVCRLVRHQGTNRSHREAIARSVRLSMPRRKFLALAIGVPSLASLAAGIWLSADSANEHEARSRDRLGANIARSNQRPSSKRGQAMQTMVADLGMPMPESPIDQSNWPGFCHALDMSNWIEAANYLYGSPLAKSFPQATQDQAVARCLKSWPNSMALGTFCSARKPMEARAVRGLCVWKDAGTGGTVGRRWKLPGKRSRGPASNQVDRRRRSPISTTGNAQSAISTARSTSAGAAIRFTQGHNFSYAHAASARPDERLFPPGRKKVVVNWDAHADLGDPFANPYIQLDKPFDRLRSANSPDATIQIASSMSIAGWILPLIYEGLLDQARIRRS